MSDPMHTPDSLILGNGRQIEIFTADEIPASAFQRLEECGEFTGDRLFLSNPKLYSAIVKLVARSLPIREIADILSVSVNTVQAVRNREGVSVDTEKERIGKRARFAAELAIDGIVSDLANPTKREKIATRDKAIIAGVMTEKAELLLGGATARVETAAIAPSHDDFNRWIKNVTPTGLCGEKEAPKEAAAALPGPLPLPDSAPSILISTTPISAPQTPNN